MPEDMASFTKYNLIVQDLLGRAITSSVTGSDCSGESFVMPER